MVSCYWSKRPSTSES